MNVKEA